MTKPWATPGRMFFCWASRPLVGFCQVWPSHMPVSVSKYVRASLPVKPRARRTPSGIMKRLGLPPSLMSDSFTRFVFNSKGTANMGVGSVQPVASMSVHTRNGKFVHFFRNSSS